MEIRFTMFCRYFVARIDNWNPVVLPWHIGADVCSRPEICLQLHLETQPEAIRHNAAACSLLFREAHFIERQRRNTHHSP